MALNLGVAALHIVDLRARLPLAWRAVYSSYFSDIAIPFGFYFLLCLVDDRAPWLRSAHAKAAVVLLASTAAEILQGLGIPFLGRTYDPWDIGMYALGVGLALALDVLVLTKTLRAWRLSAEESRD